MSTIKLNGTTSGSSIIKAPDSGSTNQTFTLPDSTGSFIADNGSGQVGIGTTTHYDATTKLTVSGRINTTNGTATGSMNYGGGAVVNMGALTNHPVNLMVNNSTKWVIDTNGNLIAEGGGGIVLGNTSYAAANALDDYEEGTFTLSIQDWSDATFSMGTVTAAKYTKVGNVVHIWVNTLITSSASNPSSGDLKLSGFPFSSQGNNAVLVPVKFGHTGTAVLSYHPRFQYYGSSGYFYGQNSSGVDGTITHIFQTSTRIGLNFSYMVS